MFHWQNENTLNSTNLSEIALYAVALPTEVNASFGGIRPQGQYPASPLSASECDKAKRGIGLSDATTIAATVTMRVGGTNEFPRLCVARRSKRWASSAGRTGSVAYPQTGMSLRGNDGNQHLSNATAMGASANRPTMFAVKHG